MSHFREKDEKNTFFSIYRSFQLILMQSAHILQIVHKLQRKVQKYAKVANEFANYANFARVAIEFANYANFAKVANESANYSNFAKW